MGESSEKVALITGASGGLGNFVTEAFLAAGATVIGPKPQRTADMLAETLRVCFGHEKMTTFVNWGFWPARMWPVAPAGALVDANWKITPAGKVWQQLTGVRDWAIPNLPSWTTEVSATTDARGQVNFTGFYGDYELVSGQQRAGLTLAKGATNYTVTLRPIPVRPAQ